MSEVVNEVSVVTKLYKLALDPANQPYIVRRNILPTLVKFLSNKDTDVVQRSAETLQLLASHPDNPDYMCREKVCRFLINALPCDVLFQVRPFVSNYGVKYAWLLLVSIIWLVRVPKIRIKNGTRSKV